jgi:hypothetical protein
MLIRCRFHYDTVSEFDFKYRENLSKDIKLTGNYIYTKVFRFQEGNRPFTFRGTETQLQNSVSNHEKTVLQRGQRSLEFEVILVQTR